MTNLRQRQEPATVTTATGRVLGFELAQMTEDARASWLAVYELGCRDGWERGYAAAEVDMAALWHQAHATVEHFAKQPTRDELATARERRLEEYQAAVREGRLHRHIVGERGIGA